MAPSRLLEAARRWQSARRISVLTDERQPGANREGWEPTEDISTLVTAIENLDASLRIDYVSWEGELREPSPPAAAVLPLMTWSYYETPAAFERFLRLLGKLRAAGAQPSADLRVLPWIAHKRYLVALSRAADVAAAPAAVRVVVPTILLPAGTRASGLAAARDALRCKHPSATSDAASVFGSDRSVFVGKPAVGGGGDGVELVRDAADDGGESEAALLRVLGSGREVLLQPFLPRVRSAGELALVFVNEELLHAVRKEPGGWGGGTPAAEAAAAEAHEAAVASGVCPSTNPCPHPSDKQPVSLLTRPPATALAAARWALSEARRQAGADDAGDGPIYLARVDLLPAGPASSPASSAASGAASGPASGGARHAAGHGALDGAGGAESETWLVSELEVGWPHLFLRADPSGRHAAAAAEGLLRHLDIDLQAAKRRKRESMRESNGGHDGIESRESN